MSDFLRTVIFKESTQSKIQASTNSSETMTALGLGRVLLVDVDALEAVQVDTVSEEALSVGQNR